MSTLASALLPQLRWFYKTKFFFMSVSHSFFSCTINLVYYLSVLSITSFGFPLSLYAPLASRYRLFFFPLMSGSKWPPRAVTHLPVAKALLGSNKAHPQPRNTFQGITKLSFRILFISSFFFKSIYKINYLFLPSSNWSFFDQTDA